MNVQFLPTDEQVMMRESVRRWTAQEHRTSDDPGQHWALFAELGWLMAALPESAGGLGGNAYDAAIIAEELGRGLVRAPFVDVAVVAAQAALALAPKRTPAIAEGAERPLLAHGEAEARGDQNWVACRADQSGGRWLLTGTKTGIVGAALATSFLVSARLPEGRVGLFEVAAAEAPLRACTTIDDRSGGELRLDATPARLVDRDAQAALSLATDHGLVVESAEALGAMQAAFDLTRDYLLTRRQYGQLIGEFQALRHRLADMFIELEQARSMVLRGLAGLVENGPDRAALAAATRARVAQAGIFIGSQAIQLHGGIGVTEEYPVGAYYKRLVAFDLRYGTGAVQVERFATLAPVLQTG